MALPPAVVHPKQHLRPILCLSTARSRMKRQNRITAVVLSRQQGRKRHLIQLALKRLRLLLDVGNKAFVLLIVG